jgi:transcriptional regulator with XRE-family HTH domain
VTTEPKLTPDQGPQWHEHHYLMAASSSDFTPVHETHHGDPPWVSWLVTELTEALAGSTGALLRWPTRKQATNSAQRRGAAAGSRGTGPDEQGPGAGPLARLVRAAAGMRAVRRHGPAAKAHTARIPTRDWRIPVTTLISPPGWIVDETGEVRLPASAPGVIGGAVIRAARRSASLSEHRLAGMLAVSLSTVRGWENGSRPLFCVRYDQLRRLAEALRQAGAHVGQETSEIVLASQCDLLIAGILRGFEDYAEVPPVDEDAAGRDARALLRWALTGQPPHRYSPYALTASLLAAPDVSLFTAIARDLQAGSHGYHLASYGDALVALTGSVNGPEGSRNPREASR